jgi:hypothetical protein
MIPIVVAVVRKCLLQKAAAGRFVVVQAGYVPMLVSPRLDSAPASMLLVALLRRTVSLMTTKDLFANTLFSTDFIAKFLIHCDPPSVSLRAFCMNLHLECKFMYRGNTSCEFLYENAPKEQVLVCLVQLPLFIFFPFV